MLGRFAAGMLAIVLISVFSLKSMGIKEAKRSENMIDLALEEFVCLVLKTGRITKEDFDELMDRVSLSGLGCIVDITVGTVIYGRTGNMIEAAYTDEVLLALSGPGGELDMTGRMLTISAVPVRKGLGAGLANLLWASYVPKEIFVHGGYVHG